VPQYVLEAGWTAVITQPRRLAARRVAQRVAKELRVELGREVGFRTAYERKDSNDTKLLFCTDGLALVRELFGAGNGENRVLILDEVHEWNLNMEVLVAWCRLQVELDPSFRVVLMSATMEAEKLSAYFNDAPVIDVPGRLFPIDERQKGGNKIEDIVSLLGQGRNVLVFEPGKREIGETIAAISALCTARGIDAEIMALHGELSLDEQDRVFDSYPIPKLVVSTNIAQTSVTIDDIDAVVDSGMERRTEVDGGVEGLYLKPISRADAKQRKGRAGRTKAGICIDWCPYQSSRLDFPMAEIFRTRLDQTVLRLAEAGFDAEALSFFHQPDISEIHEAKRALKALGCFDEKGRVTPVGKRVAQLPISVQFARMIVEADRLGVVDDVLTVAAILEQGGITAKNVRLPDGREVEARPYWIKHCPGEESSDVMAQLAVYSAGCKMDKRDLMDNGIHTKAFFQTREKRQHLADGLRGKVREFRSSGKREDILKAICAGMVDHLFQYTGGGYKNGDDTYRELNRDSVVRTASWLVGKPWDLQIKNRRGQLQTLRLIVLATKVDPTWLLECAPHLGSEEVGLDPIYDPGQDSVMSTSRRFFNSQKIQEVRVPDPTHPQAPSLFASWLASQMV